MTKFPTYKLEKHPDRSCADIIIKEYGKLARITWYGKPRIFCITDLPDGFQHIEQLCAPFRSVKQAADWIVALYYAAEGIRKDHPLPQEMNEMVQSWARNLADRAKSVRDVAWQVAHEARSLRHVCATYGITAIWDLVQDDVCGDKGLIVKDLYDMCLEGQNIPFFSETALYELLGKEDARTVLSVVARLARAADPVTDA